MKKNPATQAKVEEALNSFAKIEKALPSQQFYAGVMARIHYLKTNVWEKWSAFFLRPTVAFATICFVIVVNALVLYSKYEPQISTADTAELASSDEYNETANTLYDLEIAKP